MGNYEGILICDEAVGGKITTTTRELLSKGRELCDSINQQLSALIVGKKMSEAAEEAITFGAEKVYIVDGPPFAESHPDLYVAIFAKVCQQIAPSVIIMGQTDMGRDVAPRLAVRLGTSVCLDCVDLAEKEDSGLLLQTRPVYGGKAMAVWLSECPPQVVTMRPRSITAGEPDTSRKGEIVPVTVEIDDTMVRGRLLETVREEVKGIKLEEARVVVAGGGGIGGIEGFKLLEELARVLGGTIGISRAPHDEGWMPPTLQIGQTCHIVTPDLYIAVGISGAPQHVAGCSGSKCIVTINCDPEADMFRLSDFGLVGDYKEVLPPLIEKCRALLG